jgi:transposase
MYGHRYHILTWTWICRACQKYSSRDINGALNIGTLCPDDLISAHLSHFLIW